MRSGLIAAAAAALVLAPEMCDACSVCFSATDENRTAFLATTAFMTALPLAMIGSVALWLRHRLRVVGRVISRGDVSMPPREGGSPRPDASRRSAV